MSLTAMGLILISAIMHATWNVIGKVQASPSLYFYLYATLFSATILTLIVLPVASFSFRFSVFLFSDWHWLLATGACQTLYLLGLVNAYKTLDLSVAYPMVRALPILLVPAFSLMLFTSNAISTASWLGFFCIFIGTLLLIPFRTLRKTHLNPGLLWIFLAAIGTCGYSIIDFDVQKSWQLSLLQNDVSVAPWQISLLYICALNWATALVIATVVLITSSASQPKNSVRLHPHQAYAGLMMAASYLLVLIAMNYTEQISDVVAFRQISIPIGFLFGVLLLNEAATLIKIMGIIVVCVGLVLVS